MTLYSTPPSLLYPKNPLSSNTHFIHKNTRPSLSIKASSSSSSKSLNNNNTTTLSSNWDVVGPTSAAPAWMPRFEELDTTNNASSCQRMFESLREGFPSRWESVRFCPIDASIRGWQRLRSGRPPCGKTLVPLCSQTTNECHYHGRFTNTQNRKYVEGEIAFVDMIENSQFNLGLLYSVLKSLDYESDEEVIFHYKILLKSLDTGLKPLISESDIGSMLGYVHKHKIMYVYVEHVQNTEGTSNEDGEGDTENETEFEDEESNVEDIVNEEHIVDDVEVNMSGFKFQLDGEGKAVIEDAQEDKTSGPWVVQEQMQKEFYVGVSKTKAFRAKAKAQLQRCNPDTIVKIDVYREEDPYKTTRMFRIIYVCLGALKMGFKEDGRDLLGLDGAFMRGQYPGQMLKVVGVDANNRIYPVAYGIMESKN
ncbi:hypothetical protein Tco_0024510 [Tanacetum coccineum]